MFQLHIGAVQTEIGPVWMKIGAVQIEIGRVCMKIGAVQIEIGYTMGIGSGRKME